MFIFFGTRSANSQFFKLDNQICPNCANTDTLYAETANTYFHIFFFPFLSTGRAAKVNCTHCRKTFELKQLNPAIQDSFASRVAVLARKKPAWHSCGCSIIFLALAFLAVSTCTSYVFSDDVETDAEKAANKPFANMYAKDLAAATSSPDIKKDSISFAIREYANEVLSDELDKVNYKYFTRIKGDRLLVIMKVTDMKNVAASERSRLLSVIEEALIINDIANDKDLYMIIEGKWNPLLVRTPTASETNGRFADQELIYDFYRDELLKKGKVDDTLLIDKPATNNIELK